jgi:nitroimidazol reductase NimA-like FMN-containing flavoprotein (pyridoxamine 5'-phosphate oxidase superfamily)
VEREPALDHTTARELTATEIDQFLARPLIARMATCTAGQPHVVPVWYEWRDATLQITVDQTSRKFRNLQHNSRIAVVIDETLGGLRFRAVMLEGTAELRTQPEDWVLGRVRSIYTRYLGQEGILAPTPQRMLSEGQHAVLVIHPERLVTWDDTGAIAPVGGA